MVYQQFINYPSLTVFENIASPLRVGRHADEEVERRVQRGRRAAASWSPILSARRSSCRAASSSAPPWPAPWSRAPICVLLDEPLANLDYKLREELRAELPRIFAASGAIFVYATTEPAEALLLGGHTATLCARAASLQFGPTARGLSPAATIATARGVLRPAAEHLVPVAEAAAR